MPANSFYLSSTIKPIRLALLSVMALLASACSPINLLNSLVPDVGYQLQSASYGSHPRQQLDIYTSKMNKEKPQKVVIFFYGGSWDSGEKKDYKFVGEALSSKGFVVVIADYRLYPDVLFPDLMADPASVAKWVKTNIEQYGGDANKVFLTGHSAGAHLAVMLAVNPEYLAKQSLKPTDFAGVVALAGPYDFLPLKTTRLNTIFGEKATQWKSQPINFVDGKNPPILLGVGRKDSIVAPFNTDHIARKIKDNNGLVEVAEFANYGHIDMVAKLAKPLRGDGVLLNQMVEFLNKH